MEESSNNKAQLLIDEIRAKQQKNDKPNPLSVLKKSKELINTAKDEIEINSKDPNKLILINISDIIPLENSGRIMHNRSAMTTKDKDEIIRFAESIKLSQKDQSGLFGTGLINAITVRTSKIHNGKYELISGYRRTEAFKILNLLQIPAFILECDDKVARRLRNAENKQRRDINAYDETYGELEEIQLYCDFSTLDEAEKALRKAKRIIDLENKLFKEIDINSINYDAFINEKSKYSLDEHTKANYLKDVVLEMSQRQLNTFVNRLEILQISEKIRTYMFNNQISYSEALTIKKVLKNQEHLIDESVQYLLNSENISKKRLSTKEFELYLKKLSGYENQNRGHKYNCFTKLKSNITLLEKLNIEDLIDSDVIFQKIDELNKLLETKYL